MKMTNGDAQKLLIALRNIDANEAVRLGGQVRLDMARNINRLMPEVFAFEKATMAKRREIRPGDANLDANNKIVEELQELSDIYINVRLYKIEYSKLNLDDNPRITADVIASLAAILKDLDTLDEGGE